MPSADQTNPDRSLIEQAHAVFASAGALSRQVQDPYSSGTIRQFLRIAESLQAFLGQADAFLRKLSLQSAEATRLGIGQKHSRVVKELRTLLDGCRGGVPHGTPLTFSGFEQAITEWKATYDGLVQEAGRASLKQRCNAKWGKDKDRLDELMKSPVLAFLQTSWTACKLAADEAARDGDQTAINNALLSFASVWSRLPSGSEVMRFYSRNPLPQYHEWTEAEGGPLRGVIELLNSIVAWGTNTAEELARTAPLTELPSFPPIPSDVGGAVPWLAHPVAGFVARLELRLLPLRARVDGPDVAMRNFTGLVTAVRANDQVFPCDSNCLEQLRSAASLCSSLDEVASTLSEASPIASDSQDALTVLAIASLRSLLQANEHARLTRQDNVTPQQLSCCEQLGKVVASTELTSQNNDLIPIFQHIRFVTSSEQQCIAEAFDGGPVWEWLYKNSETVAFGPWVYAALVEERGEPVTSSWILERLYARDEAPPAKEQLAALVPFSCLSNWRRDDEDLLIWRVVVEQIAISVAKLPVPGEASWEFISKYSGTHSTLCKWIRGMLERQQLHQASSTGSQSASPTGGQLEFLSPEHWGEIEALQQYGALSSRASQALLALHELGVVETPTSRKELPLLSWRQYPRCSEAWEEGVISLKEYRARFFDDISEKSPVDYAVRLASDGRVDRAIAIAGEQNQDVSEYETLWSWQVGEQASTLQVIAQDIGVYAELQESFKALDGNRLRKNFQAAMADVHAIKEYCDSAKLTDAQVNDLKKRLIELQSQLTKDPLRSMPEQNSLLTESARLLSDVSVGTVSRDAAVSVNNLEEGVRSIQERLSRSNLDNATQSSEFVAVHRAAISAVTPHSAAATVPDRVIGVVKPHAKGPECKNFGFVAPYGGNGNADAGPIHFRRTAVSADVVMHEGWVVVCTGLTKGDLGVTAGSVRRASAVEFEEALAQLGVSDNEPRYGLVTLLGDRWLVATECFGVHALQGVRAPAAGTFVRLDARALKQGHVNIIDTDVSDIPHSSRTFLQRLVAQPADRDLQSQNTLQWSVSDACLRRLLLPTPNAIRWARELHDHIRARKSTRPSVERTIDALDATAEQKRWLRSVLVFGLLEEAHSLGGVDAKSRIDQILHELPEWLEAAERRNPDTTYHRVYTCLRDFEKKYPDVLDCDDIYNCFEAVQLRRPHFRIEILLATDKADRLDADWESLSHETRVAHFAEVRDHLERAEILNPKLAETLDLRRRLTREFSELCSEPTFWFSRNNPSSRAAEASGAIGRINSLNDIYQQFGQANAVEEARNHFKENRDILSGALRERLFLTHAAFLCDQGNAAEAELVLIECVRSGELVGGWKELFAQLERVWTDMRLQYDGIRRSITAVRASVPPEHCHLLVATGVKVALDSAIPIDSGDLRKALGDLEGACRTVVDTTSNIEDLLDRCRKRLSLPASHEEDSRATVRSRLLDDVHRIKGIEPDSSIVRLVKDRLRQSREDGAWLVLQVVKENVLTPVSAKRLVAEACEGLSGPDSALFEAQLRVSKDWQGHDGCGQLSEQEREDALRNPGEAGLTAVRSRLAIPAATTFFESLAKHHRGRGAIETERVIHLHLLKAMKDSLDKKGFVRALFHALPVMFTEDARNAAQDLRDVNLEGLACAVAISKGNSEDKKVAESLARVVVTPYWKWPDFWHEARSATEWHLRADGLVRVLATNNSHWPSCEEVLDAFGNEGPEEYDREQRLEIIDAFTQSLLKRQPTAELLTLSAQIVYLRAETATFGGEDESIRIKCSELIDDALEKCPAFSTAMDFRTKLSPQKRLRPGSRVGGGKYEVVEWLGEGGFSVVYKAKDTGSQAAVVLKVLKAGATHDHGKKFRETFSNEIKAAKELAHPNIVRVRDVVDDGRIIVMDYIEGETIHSIIEDGRTLPWRWIAKIGVQVAGALKHAFDTQQIIHRDVQPGNIIVSNLGEDPVATVIDFGLAKRGRGTSTVADVFGIVKTRWIYRAVEYQSGDRDPRIDIFGLGVILYQLLVRQGPWTPEQWESIASNYQQYGSVEDVAREEPRRASEVEPSVDDRSEAFAVFETALGRMVQVEPRSRVDSWGKVIDGLQDALAAGGAQP
jgi:serine/threonine protein kinase